MQIKSIIYYIQYYTYIDNSAIWKLKFYLMKIKSKKKERYLNKNVISRM